MENEIEPTDDARDTVTREQAHAFRELANLPIEVAVDDGGAPEPPLDRVERTRRVLQARRDAQPAVELLPGVPFAVPGPRDDAFRESVAGWFGPIGETFWENFDDASTGNETLAEGIARLDDAYERLWSQSWRFGIAPAARQRCEIEIATVAAKISGKPLTEFAADTTLAKALKPKQGVELADALHEATGHFPSLTVERIGPFDAANAGCLIALVLFVGGIAYGLWLGSAPIALALAFALPLAWVYLASVVARPAWSSPEKTIAELAEETQDAMARVAEKMLAAASPNAASPNAAPTTEPDA